MIFRFIISVCLILSLSLTSCADKKGNNQVSDLSQGQVTEKLLEANKAIIKAENDQIDKLIIRNGWEMNETGTGLRYQIIEKGSGEKAKTGMTIVFGYEVSLMNGDVIYSSAKTGPKQFKLGSGGVESGLEEGMLLLSVGDKARFIIPSYLAHGLSGDQDKIPPKATLIYTVKVLNLN
jgi:gliding motility-associated peptidyl-prolyl isomerase